MVVADHVLLGGRRGSLFKKVVATELVSVDGVMEAPEEWAFSCPNEDMKVASASQVTRPSSNASDAAMSDAFASYWPHQPGKDIGIVGSGALLRSLLASEPLDELGLMVHPLVLGSGNRFLGDETIGRR